MLNPNGIRSSRLHKVGKTLIEYQKYFNCRKRASRSLYIYDGTETRMDEQCLEINKII